jgi:hypothetical protein
MKMLKRGDEWIFRLSTLALVAVIALMCMPTVAFGDVVTMKLMGTPSGDLGGVYTSPYQITVNGRPVVLLNCDDFGTDINGSSTWYANVYTFTGGVRPSQDANLKFFTTGNTTVSNFDGTTNGTYSTDLVYDAAAILAQEILAAYQPGGTAFTKDASYSLWQLFDPLARNSIGGTDATNAETYMTSALNTARLHGFSGTVTFYTPCSYDDTSGACVTNRATSPFPPAAQEFIGVPDGGMTLMLLGGALVGLETLRRKFRV